MESYSLVRCIFHVSITVVNYWYTIKSARLQSTHPSPCTAPYPKSRVQLSHSYNRVSQEDCAQPSMAMNCLGRDAWRKNGMAWIVTVRILMSPQMSWRRPTHPPAIVVARQGVLACGLASGVVYLTYMASCVLILIMRRVHCQLITAAVCRFSAPELQLYEPINPH